MNRKIFSAGLAAAGIAATLPAPAIAQGRPLAKVAWGISSLLSGPAQSPYGSLPIALGYWKDEGLDVNVLNFKSGTECVDAIAGGKIDAGIAAPVTLAQANQNGAGLVAFFSQTTGNLAVPAVPEGSSIRKIADFRGKTIGVIDLQSGVIPIVKAMLIYAHVPLDTVQFVAVGTGQGALLQLRANRVDALAISDSGIAGIEILGQPMRRISNQFFDHLGFHQALICKRTNLRPQRPALIALARGIAKAMAFADANPEAAVRLNWTVYPASRPAGKSEEEAVSEGVKILKRRQTYTQPVNGRYGFQTRQQIQDQINVLVASGVLKPGITIDDIWSEELIADVDRFDEKAIRRFAHSWRPAATR